MVMDIILFSVTVAVGIYHSVYLHRLNRYLEMNHPMVWEKIKAKHFFWIPAEDFPYLRGNPFKELRFVFSPDNLDDESLSQLKTRTKFSLLLFLALAVSIFFFI